MKQLGCPVARRCGDPSKQNAKLQDPLHNGFAINGLLLSNTPTKGSNSLVLLY